MAETYREITLPSGHVIRVLDNEITLPRWSVPPKDFWRRFTVAEREALQNILATGTQNQKNKLNAFRDYIQTGGNVELNDDYIIASINTLETVGIIAAGRAAQILTP